MLSVSELKAKIRKLKNSIKASGITAARRTVLTMQMRNAQLQLDAMNKQTSPAKKKPTTNKAELSKAVSLAQKYRKQQGGVPTDKKDILQDANKPALPRGKRVSSNGVTYYENRENHSDRNPKRFPKLANGGQLNDEERGNYEMIESEIKSVMHHAKELKNILNSNKDVEVEAWILGKIERAATDLSDIAHYQDGLDNN